ncbi:MAG: hypothetical protein OXR73_22945 [Myxococcales bacterium]|nr:hypothetical protein [Myxococcales bacterium]
MPTNVGELSLPLYAERSITSASMPSSASEPTTGTTAAAPALRPQSVMFTLLAEQVLPAPCGVFSGSFVDVLGELAIGEHTARSTLARMVKRGLLTRERHGRKVFLEMTPRCVAILEDGRRRIWQTGAVNTAEGDWTLLTFSLPESARSKRGALRARLRWEGFGMLQNGVWLSPASFDANELIEELSLHEQVRVFRTRPAPPTDAAQLVAQVFDLPAIAERYRVFMRCWQRADVQQGNSLLLTLRLSTHWLQVIRDDPRVPVAQLPADWPAADAQELFRSLHGRHAAAARARARALLDVR